jgi:signal transduction histidine kinase
VLSALLARRTGAITPAASSPADLALLVAAAGAAIAAGLFAARAPEDRQFGLLLVAAAVGWLVSGWPDPAVGSAWVFTLGLVGRAVDGPLVAHATSVGTTGPRRPRLARSVLGFGYGVALLGLGLVPAILYVPGEEGCIGCPVDLVGIVAAPAVARAVVAVAGMLAAGWAVVTIAMLVRDVAGSPSPLRRRTLPVLVAGAAFLGCYAVGVVGSITDPRAAVAVMAAWRGEALALLGLAGAVVLRWEQARRTRRQVAQLVVDLAASPRPGELSDALARVLGDPDARLLYPLDDGRLVDAAGREAEAEPDPEPGGRIRTPLLRGQVAVALLEHRPGLERDRSSLREVARAASLGLESERLHAEAGALVEDLRRSRARIVEADDRERRTLERNLHDGAQQRLVAVTMDVGVLAARLAASGDTQGQAAMTTLRRELESIHAELRELAHGVFPVILADEGLGPAVDGLREDEMVTLRVESMPDRRLPSIVETSAFLVIATAARGASAEVVVDVGLRDGQLLVDVRRPSPAPPAVADLGDRIDALGGKLSIAEFDGTARIQAEIPCGS